MIWIGLVIMLAAAIQGMTSFGFSLVALPLLSLFLPLPQIVALLVMYSLGLNLILLVKLVKHIHIKMITMLLVGGVLGTPLGIMVLNIMDASLLKRTAGIAIVVIGLLLMKGWRMHLKQESHFYLPIGLVSGVMQGALSLSGPPLVLFLSNQNKDKMVFRANLTAYFTLLNAVTLPGFIMGGLVGPEILGLGLKYLPFMLAGLFFGMMMVSRIDDLKFKKMTLLLIVVSGLMAIITA